ncbi:hypothetical protein BV22DRAFT_1163741 [Leucogyrophana mollusca]|uniref:Uncharacterized protein n=1 Tax=Leucogyrophana mollusca TaxID=85980 RepID=A0ACB8BG06_9AGAM|nr:hypothetical protein BV22DRAFT_1163741 [Leucogyrophana mollusca]
MMARESTYTWGSDEASHPSLLCKLYSSPTSEVRASVISTQITSALIEDSDMTTVSKHICPFSRNSPVGGLLLLASNLLFGGRCPQANQARSQHPHGLTGTWAILAYPSLGLEYPGRRRGDRDRSDICYGSLASTTNVAPRPASDEGDLAYTYLLVFAGRWFLPAASCTLGPSYTRSGDQLSV